MKGVEQIYTGCLAEAAYFIYSNGEAAVIDPLRETKPYLDRARSLDVTIKYVFETHFHADFVSGHIDLAKQTDAKIVYGPNAKTGYDAHIATDGEIFKVGEYTIKVLHTPGHTMESTTYLLIDEAGQEHAIFTGDTLFIGDVGRPDLAVKSDLTQEDLAKNLFHSLRNKIMTLPDDVIVYPAHGAGSACGKNMSKETYDTLGNQKQKNYALRSDMTIEEFVTEVTTGLSAPPKYFPQNVMMNKMGYESIDNVMKTGLQALDPDQFEDVANAYGAVVIDTRKAEHFAAGFIPNSINIGIDGQFAPWVGALLPDVKQHILIIADDGREEEVVLRLARVGYDFCLGYLKGGFTSWKNSRKDFDTITSISANELEKRYNKGEELAILDVRRPSEFAAEHLENANNIPLDFINDYMAEINPNQHYYIHCAGGYRSMIFASILKARGFDNITDVAGGFKAIAENTQMKRTDYVCPSTLKKS